MNDKFEKYFEETTKIKEKIRKTAIETHLEMVTKLVKEHLFKNNKRVDADVLIMFMDEIVFVFIAEFLNAHFRFRNRFIEETLKDIIKHESD